MPGMSGLEVLQHARKIAPDLICILITGYATVELAVQAMREGAQDFIAKPFTSELLLRVINRELERLHLKREAERAVLLEEQNRELSRVTAEMTKLAAIESRFMLTMVHILRAPVAVLQNSLQLIRKGYVPEKGSRHFLNAPSSGPVSCSPSLMMCCCSLSSSRTCISTAPKQSL